MIAHVGIVIIGRNEGKRLRACLDSVLASGVPLSRIIYVDSGSTDGSVQAASALGFACLELSAEAPFCAARARTEGFFTLTYREPALEYVQFLDADCILSKDWIGRALTFMGGRSDIALVCGRRRESGGERSFYRDLCDMEWDGPQGEVAACGGDFFVRTSAFRQVGGFNPALIAGEEPEMCLRLRALHWRIWRLPEEMTLHDAAISRFAQWWRRTVRSGFGYSQVASLHRRDGAVARPLVSALAWGGVLPAVIIAGSVTIHPLMAGLALLYPIQMSRIAIARGASDQGAWWYAFFTLIAKFAELYGALKFISSTTQHRMGLRFEYKH